MHTRACRSPCLGGAGCAQGKRGPTHAHSATCLSAPVSGLLVARSPPPQPGHCAPAALHALTTRSRTNARLSEEEQLAQGYQPVLGLGGASARGWAAYPYTPPKKSGEGPWSQSGGALGIGRAKWQAYLRAAQARASAQPGAQILHLCACAHHRHGATAMQAGASRAPKAQPARSEHLPQHAVQGAAPGGRGGAQHADPEVLACYAAGRAHASQPVHQQRRRPAARQPGQPAVGVPAPPIAGVSVVAWGMLPQQGCMGG